MEQIDIMCIRCCCTNADAIILCMFTVALNMFVILSKIKDVDRIVHTLLIAYGSYAPQFNDYIVLKTIISFV